MKKGFAFGIICFLLLGYYLTSVMDFNEGKEAIREKEKEVLVEAFEASKANFVEVNVHTTVHIPNTFWEIEEMEILLQDLMKALDLEGDIENIDHQEYYDPYFLEMRQRDYQGTIFIHKVSEIGYHQFRVMAPHADGKFTVILLHTMDIEGEKEAHIIIDIVQNKRYKDIVEVSNQCREILMKYGSNIETTMCFVGTYKGRMSEEEKQDKIEEMMGFVQAKKVEEVVEESYISTTLYTPLISEAIRYQQKNVNLHIAMRYNSYEDQTYLWLATPLITAAY